MHFLTQTEIFQLITTYGYAIVGVIIALESMGVPLPGETTLIAAALFASTADGPNIWLVIVAASGGAIIGDNIGFFIGRELGFCLLVRYGRYIGLEEPRIKLGQYLFLRYGGAVVFFGRFVAVLRALAAFLAGVNCMSWPRFLIYNASGGIIWALVYGLAAYYLGREAKRLAEPIAIAAGVLAFIVIVGAAVFVHRREGELTLKAEAAFPGPITRWRNRAHL